MTRKPKQINESKVLTGKMVRLEPLAMHHIEALTLAAAGNEQLFQWTMVPQGQEAMTSYVKLAIAERNAGTAAPFAIISKKDGHMIGSTRFWNLCYWPWPADHSEFGRITPDVCEIGHTWLTASQIKTGINTEVKFLMLQHAFEDWKVWRVNFTTDVRNLRSRAAILRLGAKFEGVIRADRMAADFTVRDSARFSILKEDWESVKSKLQSYILAYQ